MMKHRLGRLLGAVAWVGLGLLGLSPLAQAQSARTLQMGIGLAADSPQGKAASDFAARVSRYTGGKLVVDVQAAGALGNDVSMVKALREGTLAMTIPDTSTLAGFVKGFSVINYPFTFQNEAEADAVLDGPWGSKQLAQLPAHGLVGLAYWENGFRHLTNSRRPISSALDFEGVRLRVMQNDLLVDSFSKLGFDAVPMPFSQLYDAMKTQAVDGQENPLPTILTSRFYEVQKYLTLSRHVYSTFAVLISGKVWDGLPAEQQAALKKAALESGAYQRKLNREASELALSDLKAKGMVVSFIPRADAERVRNRLRSVFDKHNTGIGAATVIELYVALGQLRAQNGASRSGTGAASGD